MLRMLLPRTLLTLLNIFKDNYFSPRPVINVPGVGRLRGSTLKSGLGERDYHGYWGIPYGQPPLGERRFLPPLPAQPLRGEFDAGQLRFVLSPRSCPQPGFTLKQTISKSLLGTRRGERDIARYCSSFLLTVERAISTPCVERKCQ